MAQLRLGNNGETATVWVENASRKYVLPKGVYEGFSLGVTAAADLEIAPGAGVQHDGIVWFEGLERVDGDVEFDSSITITVEFTPPGAATDYTIVATHVSSSDYGGSAVTYALQSGILDDSTVTDGVILGWIRHPGSGTPLDTTMLQEVPKQRSDLYARLFSETAPIEDIPDFTRAIDDPSNSTTGADITIDSVEWEVATFTLYQDVTRSTASLVGAQYVIQHFHYYVPDAGHRPNSFDVWVDVTAAPGTDLTLELFDTAQSPVTLSSGGTITTTTGWESHSIVPDLTSGTFTAGSPYTLRLTYNLAIGGQIKIGRVRANYWPFG